MMFPFTNLICPCSCMNLKMCAFRITRDFYLGEIFLLIHEPYHWLTEAIFLRNDIENIKADI